MSTLAAQHAVSKMATMITASTDATSSTHQTLELGSDATSAAIWASEAKQNCARAGTVSDVDIGYARTASPSTRDLVPPSTPTPTKTMALEELSPYLPHGTDG